MTIPDMQDDADESLFRTISVSVNGRSYKRRVSVRKNLVDFLREDVGFTGTHIGCEHGVCGACTVKIDGKVARSCLMFAVQANGSDVTTIEGLAGEELHPMQQAFWDHHALQCGFCTPGMLMTAIDMVERKVAANEGEVRAGLSGNTCRCTGYQFIVDATLAVARQVEKQEVR